ncbi:MAG: RsmB/NOP family class I SAM-dependent RNA methyltransferase [Archangium sp.]|nr:RsmB/NOP family class I SAM-dependent RNA methyltransferase [Archangium sp.]
MTSLRNRPLREDLVIQASLEAYALIRHEGRLSDRALETVLRPKKHLYSSERRATAERVYALLRRQRLVDYLAEKAFKDFKARGSSQQDLLRLALSRVLDGETARAAGKAMTLSSGEIDGLERAIQHKSDLKRLPPLERLAIEASVPDFFAAKLQREYGDEAHAAAEAMNERAPLCIRVNELKITRAELMTRLETEEVKAKLTPLSPIGLFLETRHNAYALPSFKEGLFEIQDEGSQLLGMLVDAPPRKVVDACAGAGGKTLQLAAQMKNRGELFALDIDARRLEDLKLRARRDGVHNVRIQALPKDDDAALEEVLKKLQGVERVLVDAPCSGSGTYRRKPDARYKLDEAMLADHVSRQKTLLARFAPLVKRGGRVVYGTCSVLREENEDVVADFLSKHADFRIAPAGTWLGEALAASCTRDGMLRLTPHRHGTDGFFGVVLERTA